MKLLNKLNALKKDKKGFTLIEIVIVIVIIAILAAMLVPSMLSWIDKANQRTFLSACDSIRTSASTVISDNYAAGKANLFSDADSATLSDLVGETVVVGTGSDAKTYYVTATFTENGKKIATLVVKNSKYTGTWNGSEWTVS